MSAIWGFGYMGALAIAIKTAVLFPNNRPRRLRPPAPPLGGGGRPARVVVCRSPGCFIWK